MSITIRIDQQPETEVNYSNRNAAIVLGALGIDTSEGYGEIDFAELPRLRQRAIRALHQAWEFRPSHRPTRAVRPASLRSTAADHPAGRSRHRPGHRPGGCRPAPQGSLHLLAVAHELRSGVTWC
ncbi:hypothetical protein [Candidatus Accumulibacter sp. ACC012]|uniref:hypothetical protein n=1 Tax=Candidatus Accumulibacter sp. ACC012 TaxID=2823332 RepID=UPI0025B8E988|nr:hypothetical protein [Candidatus Accumulibacter sp. ACC012]